MSRLKIDTCALQRIEARTLLKEKEEADKKAPSRAKPAIPYGVLPASTTLAEQLGAQSQVAQQWDPGQRRSWGVQNPSHTIW
jgi:hypothetical protein